MTARRRLPPFGRALRDRLRAGWRPPGRTIHVAAGSRAFDLVRAWQREPQPRLRAWFALFDDCDPAVLDWSLAKGFDVIAFGAGDLPSARADAIAVAAFTAGAARVLIVHNVDARVPRLIRYRARAVRGVAA